MATSRQESDCAPERKRARIVVESSSTSLSSSTGPTAPLSRWEWSSAANTIVGNPYHHLAAAINVSSPDQCGNSSDSVSLSGSSEGGGAGGQSPKSSPISTPQVSNFQPSIPKSMTAVVCSSSFNGLVGNGILQTPQVSVADLRPCLIRSSNLNDDQNGNGSAVGIVAPWQLQDFGDGLALDASLSGLSDLAAPAYVNEMMEFVKRQSSQPPNNGNGLIGSDSFFQFILMAPTSAAVKVHEEPLTYLNQSQSYEIKCKKLGAEGMMPGRLLKSIIRVTFHDRRQKFQERELMDQWKRMHAGEKITDTDIPMSYNVFNVRTDPLGTMMEFLWDPTKSTSVFIKVNCISTEFTARKHGGEKGVPFRLQVDTYLYGDEVEQKRLHSSYTQIKVFKTKGADRKNKTDREKADKRADKEKYQPPYDYTILTETFPTDVYDFEQQQQQAETSADESAGHEKSPVPIKMSTSPPIQTNQNVKITCGKQMENKGNLCRASQSSMENGLGNHISSGHMSPVSMLEERETPEALPMEAAPAETAQWLRRHRFGSYLNVFNSFSGADFLRLSREDLIQICGTADGIRLFNALQYKKVLPKLTLYMCVPGAPAFHAVFLVSITLQELVRKMCEMIQIDSSQVFDVYCQGPDGINVHMNDEVVQNLPDRSRYLIDAMKCGDEQSERYRILLKANPE